MIAPAAQHAGSGCGIGGPVRDGAGFPGRNRATPGVDLSSAALHEVLRRLCEEADAVGDLMPDAVIGAIAVEHGCEVVTLDRDFARFASVRHRRPVLVGGSGSDDRVG